MPQDQLRYDRMVESAFRGVVRDALKEVEKRGGLPGEHHFYITFRTQFPGVQIPDYLKAQYAHEMTIVLQYQFYGLEVTAERVSVTLSFGGKHERLVVPFAAITIFADPSVDFSLRFQPLPPDAALADAGPEDIAAAEAESAQETPAEEPKGATVVALDAFRKK